MVTQLTAHGQYAVQSWVSWTILTYLIDSRGPVVTKIVLKYFLWQTAIWHRELGFIRFNSRLQYDCKALSHQVCNTYCEVASSYPAPPTLLPRGSPQPPTPAQVCAWLTLRRRRSNLLNTVIFLTLWHLATTNFYGNIPNMNSL